MRRVLIHLVAAGAMVAAAMACGSDPEGSTIGGSSGNSGSSGAGAQNSVGGGLTVGGSSGTSTFDAAGGWGGGPSGGSNSGGQGGGTTCVPQNCPAPVYNGIPGTPCCIPPDLCGGDFGDGNGCRYVAPQTQPGNPVNHRCNEAPPPGAQLAAPPPTYAGTCPTLIDGFESGNGLNTIVSSGAQRTFMLALPMGLRPEEKLPVVFMWHWLGGDASSFFNGADAHAATNLHRFIAVFPNAKGDLFLKWPYSTEPASRFAEEYKFFEDMYACIAQQFNVQPNCISSGGVSAGGLWTTVLAGNRSQYIASFASLSGGVILPWPNPPHKSPAVVLWGGPNDTCGINFEQSSRALEQSLTANGNFMIECVHQCNHSVPPFSPPSGQTKYSAIWQFVFDHPYWLGAGQSPYLQTGLPAGWPSWCGIGANSATPGGASGCVALTQCL